jgi:hypothetical protein
MGMREGPPRRAAFENNSRVLKKNFYAFFLRHAVKPNQPRPVPRRRELGWAVLFPPNPLGH